MWLDALHSKHHITIPNQLGWRLTQSCCSLYTRQLLLEYFNAQLLSDRTYYICELSLQVTVSLAIVKILLPEH
jgi:hypothetical protein